MSDMILHDTTKTGGHDPMEQEDENIESTEEKVVATEATKKRRALNWKKKKQ